MTYLVIEIWRINLHLVNLVVLFFLVLCILFYVEALLILVLLWSLLINSSSLITKFWLEIYIITCTKRLKRII